ncbi:ABC transporter permease [Deinococcus pimensis]|uniref:ABC transporter permease n=1 Tax=Deinococcus pimensis TaxID=309888 RepID=UPI0004AD531F|nr:ABC-2 family transporter protein [Deinococcus pimensis]
MRAAASLGRKFRAIFSAQLANMVAYRAELIIWMLSGTLSFIMMAIWISQARAAGGEIGGFTEARFASYFTGTWVTGQLLVVWVAWELDVQIRLGNLSPKLLRPLDPLWEHLSNHLGDRLVRAPFIALLACLPLLLVPGAGFTTDPRVYAAYLLVVALGLLIRFLIEYCIGLLCFWTESATSFSEISWLVYAALGGVFAPLQLYPEALRRVARLTPFPYMVNLPATMLAGDAAWGDVGRGVLVLLGWAAALGTLRLVMWRLGLRRYGAVGA